MHDEVMDRTRFWNTQTNKRKHTHKHTHTHTHTEGKFYMAFRHFMAWAKKG